MRILGFFTCCAVLLGCGSLACRASPADAAVQDLAREAVTELSTGKYPAFFARFDGTMKAAIPEAKLAEIWKAITAQAGTFQSQAGVQLPGLNHLFQTSKTGSIMEYGQIEETIAPAALELITSWILEIVDGTGNAKRGMPL